MRFRILLPLLLWSAISFAAERPPITNAKLIARPATHGLAAEVKAIVTSDGGPAWIGYAAPVIAGKQTMCCFDDDISANQNCCGGCRLEDREGGVSIGQRSGCTAAPSSVFAVLLRTEAGAITKVRPFSTNCELDAGGRTVYWLEDVKPAESIAFLESLAADTQAPHSRADGAVTAIAMHDDAAADGVLAKLAQAAQPPHTREQAIFWLGEARGDRGLDLVLPIIASDPDRRIREHAVFAVSQSSDHQRAIRELMRMARQDPNEDVRGQAIFWLAQAAGSKAAGTITSAIENDPETEVKKKAVFALTQMPDNEGVPLLIEQVKNNRNPVVRKEAMFWLGQSHDPRALEFIESVLNK
jgi:hypothetical protein